MGKGSGPWQDGRRAWQRLNGWHQDAPAATPGHADDGDDALAALADVGHVRHLLDQAELVAVRTARRHGKSWSEIATKLGVTRQSAWQRWRELDEERGGVSADDTPTVTLGAVSAALVDSLTDRPADSVADSSADSVAGGAAASREVPAEVIERAAREQLQRFSVVVPNVIGMSWNDARDALHDRRLVAVGGDPDGPPLAAQGWPDGVVTDQSPEAGAEVRAGTPVTLWIERGGGSGVREPRRPGPKPKTARELRYEPSEEAVG